MALSVGKDTAVMPVQRQPIATCKLHIDKLAMSWASKSGDEATFEARQDCAELLLSIQHACISESSAALASW